MHKWANKPQTASELWQYAFQLLVKLLFMQFPWLCSGHWKLIIKYG